MTVPLICAGLTFAGWWVAVHAGTAWQRSEHWSSVIRLNLFALSLHGAAFAVLAWSLR